MTRLEAAVRRVLAAVWWIAFPLFAALAVRFSYERACMDPYELIQPVMRRQALALMVSAVYLGAYVWLVAAGVLTARAWDGALATPMRALWGGDRFKVAAMAVAVALEQVPRAVWSWLYKAGGACT